MSVTRCSVETSCDTRWFCLPPGSIRTDLLSCPRGDPQNHHLANVAVTVARFQNLLRHHEVLENGTAWSNSSESSDDSSSPQLSAGGLSKSINHKVKLLDSVPRKGCLLLP